MNGVIGQWALVIYGERQTSVQLDTTPFVNEK